jgi:hypothetical protein
MYLYIYLLCGKIENLHSTQNEPNIKLSLFNSTYKLMFLFSMNQINEVMFS